MSEWTTLGELRDGALFKTQDGILAVKSKYRYNDRSQVLCILLESGEYARFPYKDATPVCEVLCDLSLLEARVRALEVHLTGKGPADQVAYLLNRVHELEEQAEADAEACLAMKEKLDRAEARARQFYLERQNASALATNTSHRLDKALSVIEELSPIDIGDTWVMCPICQSVSRRPLAHLARCPWLKYTKSEDKGEEPCP